MVLISHNISKKIGQVNIWNLAYNASAFTIIGFLFLLSSSVVVNGEQVDDDDVNSDELIPTVEGDGGNVTIKVDVGGVYILTNDNFDIVVLSKTLMLVEFYAPWCSHCKQLAPEFEKASEELSKLSPPIPLGKVDATIETSLATRFEINGFPTLLVFRSGKHSEYDGPRTAQGIVEHMKQLADPNWSPPKEIVITLVEDNFTQTVTNEDLILVEFFAPWCGHCKRLAPEYERAAKQLAQLTPPIKLAKIDATTETKLAKQFEVSGYPTLLVFRRGKKYTYNGPREERGIVEYMKNERKSPSEVVTSVTQLKKLLSDIAPTVVGFFVSDEHSAFESFIDAAFAERERRFKFLHTFDSAIAKELKESMNSVVLFQAQFFQSKHEPQRYRLPLVDDTITATDISYFIGNNSLPLVGHRNYQSAWQYSGKYPLVVVYYDVDFSFDHRKQTQLIRNQVVKVASEFRSAGITFTISNEDDYHDELKDLGLDDSGEDVNVGYFASLRLRYAMPPTDEFDADVLRKFVANVQSGKVKPKIKSQLAPIRNDGPVAIVVGDTFDKLVVNSDVSVLLEFYAPWCGHCKKLEPIYTQLAHKFASKRNLVVIAKIDATSNDYPEEFEVSGFPTIYWIAKNKKRAPQLYNGDRSLDDLSKFVNQMLDHDLQLRQGKDVDDQKIAKEEL